MLLRRPPPPSHPIQDRERERERERGRHTISFRLVLPDRASGKGARPTKGGITHFCVLQDKGKIRALYRVIKWTLKVNRPINKFHSEIKALYR